MCCTAELISLDSMKPANTSPEWWRVVIGEGQEEEDEA